MQHFTHNLLAIMLSATALFLIFRASGMLLQRLISNKKLKNRLLKTVLFIELTVWFIFLYRIVENLKDEKPVLSLIAGILLLLIVVWAFLYLLKDYFAGLYFKIFEDYQLTNRISFNELSGIIIAFKNRYLILQTTKGNIKIPYSRLFKEQIIQLPEKNEEEFSIFLSIKKSDISEDFIENLRTKILLMPWINLKYPPEIDILDKENENIRIKLVLLDAKYKKNVEEYLL